MDCKFKKGETFEIRGKFTSLKGKIGEAVTIYDKGAVPPAMKLKGDEADAFWRQFFDSMAFTYHLDNRHRITDMGVDHAIRAGRYRIFHIRNGVELKNWKTHWKELEKVWK